MDALTEPGIAVFQSAVGMAVKLCCETAGGVKVVQTHWKSEP